MKCYQCNTPLSDGAKFCPLCGARNDGTANFCSSCGKPVDPDSQFCAECGAPVEKIEQKEEKKIELPVSGVDIAMDLGEKLLENMTEEGELSHYKQVHDAKGAQAESLARSEAPAKPQTSTQGSGASVNKIKRSAVSARDAASKQARSAVSETSVTEISQEIQSSAVSVQPCQAAQAETMQTPAYTPAENSQISASAPGKVAQAAGKAAQAVSAPQPAQIPTPHIPVAPVASATASVATEVAHAAGTVAVEGVKKAGSTAKTVAIWAVVLAFLIGAISACLAFFVPAPEDTVDNLIASVEELDYDKLLGCFDSKTEKQIRAVLGITGDLMGSLTGISLNWEDLMDMAPAMAPYLEIPDLGIADAETVLYADCSEKKIMEYCITANNGGSIPSGYLSDNEIVNFLMEYNISLPGLENLIAKTAIVKIVLPNGEVGYLPLINEGWGDWRIPLMDLAASLEGLG